MTAEVSDPFMGVEAPWEDHLRHPNVVLEDGVYRLWYGTRDFACYAESDDAVTWRRPDIGIHEFEGIRNTNILFGAGISPQPDYFNLASVFVDPSAPSQQKYKALYHRKVNRQVIEAYEARYPGEISPQYQEGADEDLERTAFAVGGAYSPDGIRWTPYPLPLMLHRADTHNIAYYDEARATYVGYFRTHVFRRRSIGRSETDDFAHFPLPETIIWPDPGMNTSEVRYSICRTAYPGVPDYHMMFGHKWRITDDLWHHRLATSPDGVLRGVVPGDDVIPCGEGRSWNDGSMAVGTGMVELPRDRVGMPATGFHVPHNHSRWRPLGQFAWVSWQRGRIVALRAAEHGEFTTKEMSFEGNSLRLNVRTKHVGSVQVEAVRRRGKDVSPIEGRTFEDCDPISGDCLDQVVTWRGNPAIGHHPEDSVSFRVKLSYGELFSMRFG